MGTANCQHPPNEWVQRYLDHCRVEKRLADRTLALYQLDLEKLCAYCASAGIEPLEVNEAWVRRWVGHMRQGGRSGRGIALILSGWRGFYHWLTQQRLINSNPVADVRPPKRDKPLPKALGVDQALQLAEFQPVGEGPWLVARDKAMVEMLYGCGLRVGELIALDLRPLPQSKGWFDLSAGLVTVTGKGNKQRTVPLSGKALQALTEWVALRQEGLGHVTETLTTPSPLFMGRYGTRLTAQSIWQRLRRWALQAGLPSAVHPHMLRHSFASHILQSSGDLRAVQELLGHANITTTQVYTRLDFQHLAKVYDNAHPRAKRVT